VNYNRVILAGNICADPVSRQAGESLVTMFTIAVNRRFKDKEETAFVDCEAWGKSGELIAANLRKGSPIHIEGRLKSDKWQTQAGEKRQKLMVVVDNFQYLTSAHGGAAPRDEQESEPAPRRAAPAPLDDDQPPF
jgi:single-strand DNA-binding protein